METTSGAVAPTIGPVVGNGVIDLTDGTSATATRAAPAPTPVARREEAAGYRTEIDGLRALAVVLVMLFHAGVTGLEGGYVGVDVFFVVSGFLITSRLLGDASGSGVNLLAFYAGRARRLLPLSIVVVVATVAAAAVVQPVGRFTGLLGDARAALLYVSNWHFAGGAVAYTDTTASESLLTHFWSLSVEEQFYFGWPLLCAAAAWVAGRAAGRGTRSRAAVARILIGVLAATITAISLVLSITRTASEGSRAYYLTHLRLWEIGAGAVVAVILGGIGVGRPALAGARRWVVSALQLVALAAILGAALMMDERTLFPGHAALVPVLGTAVLLGIGGRGTVVDRAMSMALFRRIGERSYALYLWHWPLLGLCALVADRSGRVSPGWAAAVAVALAVVLSAVTYRLVENPIRFSVALRIRPGWTVLAAVVCSAGLIYATGPVGRERQAAQQAEWAAASMTPSQAEADSAEVPFGACNQSMVESGSAISWCTAGDPAGTRTIALVGDSHAQMWAPALDAAGRGAGWRVLVTTRSACLPYAVLVRNTKLGLPDENCRIWAEALPDAIRSLGRVDAVVVARSRAYPSLVTTIANGDLDPEMAGAAIGEAARRFLERLGPVTDRVLVVQDTPWARRAVPDCLGATDPAKARDCDFPASDAGAEVETPMIRAELAAIAASPSAHDTMASLTDAVCPGGSCPAVTRSGTITYRDRHHLTATYSRELAGPLANAVNGVLTP